MAARWRMVARSSRLARFDPSGRLFVRNRSPIMMPIREIVTLRRCRQTSEIAGSYRVRRFPMPAPIPPFTRETAIAKVRMAEDGWNSRDPHRVSLAYTEDSRWRNRAEFVNGRAEIVGF